MIVALLGWPALFAGLLFSVAGVLVRRWTLLLLGALLTLPLFGYLALTPRFSFVVLMPGRFRWEVPLPFAAHVGAWRYCFRCLPWA